MCHIADCTPKYFIEKSKKERKKEKGGGNESEKERKQVQIGDETFRPRSKLLFLTLQTSVADSKNINCITKKGKPEMEMKTATTKPCRHKTPTGKHISAFQCASEERNNKVTGALVHS